MAVRTPRGDDQGVGEGAFAFEIDEDDVLGFLVVEAPEYQGLERGAAADEDRFTGGDGGRRLRRWRDFRSQRELLLRTGSGAKLP